MLCAVVVCIAAVAGGQQAAPDAWFTLTGDRLDTSKNLIEILPEPIGIDQRVLLDLRVSRDQQRTSFRGQKYRSYYAKVVVDCPARRAWYLHLSYYAQPIWAGDVIAKEQYKEGEAEVLFKDMPSQWAQRLVTAACKVRKLSG
ncbi:MAG: surface-adhesin E family protein [Acidovorax sp.]|uniref:surface-adhesin E family protein n=1 Tax=Acidovorax sp. TaxID=1872122 RepID=UPI00391D66D5